ncbi:MAG: hypothetical protein R3F19_24890 [Verrucomicrobiales bacterium]
MRYSSIRGGTGDDQGLAVTIISRNRVMVTGSTSSTDFPGLDAFQETYGGGDNDGILINFNSDSATGAVTFASYFGGSGTDLIRAVTQEPNNFGGSNRLWIAGVTGSADLPVMDAIQPTFGGGDTEGFLSSFTFPNAGIIPALETSTFLGGSGEEGITALSMDPVEASEIEREVAFAGATTSDDFTGSIAGLRAPRDRFPRDGEEGQMVVGTTGEGKSVNLKIEIVDQQFKEREAGTQKATFGTLSTTVRISNVGPDHATGVLLDHGKFLSPDRTLFTISATANGIPLTVASSDSNGTPSSWIVGEVGVGASINIIILEQVRLFATAQNDQNISLQPDFSVSAAETDSDPTDNEVGGLLASTEFAITGSVFIPLPSGASSTAATLRQLADDNTWGSSPSSSGEVALNNGSFHYEIPLLTYGTPPGMKPFEIRLVYDSAMLEIPDTFLAPGWRLHPLASASTGQTNEGAPLATFYVPNGDWVSFEKIGDSWQHVGPLLPIVYELEESSAWFYLIDPNEPCVFGFEQVGDRPVHRFTSDTNGNGLVVHYDNGLGSPPTSIDDRIGGSVRVFSHPLHPGGLPVVLTSLEDHSGRKVDIDYNANGTLSGITLPGDCKYGFIHDPEFPDFIQSITEPDGNAPVENTFELIKLGGKFTVGMKYQLQKSDGVGFDWSDTPDETKVEVTLPTGATWTVESAGPRSGPTAMKDPDDKELTITRDLRDAIAEVTTRGGSVFTYERAPDTGRIVERIAPDKDGQPETSFSQTFEKSTIPFVNPVSGDTIEVAANFVVARSFGGELATWERDAKGNVISSNNVAGGTTKIDRNERGQPATVTTPDGGINVITYEPLTAMPLTFTGPQGTTTYTYNERRLLESVIRAKLVDEASAPIQTCEYDINNHLVHRVDFDGYDETFLYDKNGNLKSVADDQGCRTLFTYDGGNRFVQWAFGPGDLGAPLDPDQDLYGTIARDAQTNSVNYEQVSGLDRVIVFDSLGRPLTDGVRNYVYGDDSRSLPAKITANGVVELDFSGIPQVDWCGLKPGFDRTDDWFNP